MTKKKVSSLRNAYETKYTYFADSYNVDVIERGQVVQKLNEAVKDVVVTCEPVDVLIDSEGCSSALVSVKVPQKVLKRFFCRRRAVKVKKPAWLTSMTSIDCTVQQPYYMPQESGMEHKFSSRDSKATIGMSHKPWYCPVVHGGIVQS